MRHLLEYWDIQQTILFVSVQCMMLLLLAPFFRWLQNGWNIRKEEFENQIQDGALKLYIKTFWNSRISGLGENDTLKQIFDEIYNQQFGKKRYLFPLLLLTIVGSIALTLAVQSALYYPDTAVQPEIHLPILGVSAVMGAYLFVVTDAIQKGHQRCFYPVRIYTGIFYV